MSSEAGLVQAASASPVAHADEELHVDMPASSANGALHVNGNGANGRPSSSPGGSHFNMVNKPTFLETPNGLRFLIMDCPNDANLQSYMDVLKKRQVVVVTRVCEEPAYSTGPLLANGVKVLDLGFPDGDPPPPHVVKSWLALVDQVFKRGGQPMNGNDLRLDMAGVSKPAIAIHCVAGLGRAPVMVAIALVENGMEPFDAIAFIRKKRRGAINSRQLKYIENYRPERTQKGCCTVQ